jgi:hypothetical protein
MRNKLLGEFRPGPFGAVLWEGHDPVRYGHALLLLALEQQAVMGLRDAANDALLLLEADPGGFGRLCRDLERPETRALIAAYIHDANEGTALRVLIPWRDDSSLAWPEAELRINLEPLRAALQEQGIAPMEWDWEREPSPRLAEGAGEEPDDLLYIDPAPDAATVGALAAVTDPEAIPALQGGYPAGPGAAEEAPGALDGQAEPHPPAEREPTPAGQVGATAPNRP